VTAISSHKVATPHQLLAVVPESHTDREGLGSFIINIMCMHLLLLLLLLLKVVKLGLLLVAAMLLLLVWEANHAD
jgi:hypothetical protein